MDLRKLDKLALATLIEWELINRYKKFESEPHLRPLFLNSAKPYNSLNQHNMPNASDG